VTLNAAPPPSGFDRALELGANLAYLLAVACFVWMVFPNLRRGLGAGLSQIVWTYRYGLFVAQRQAGVPEWVRKAERGEVTSEAE
jgi:hypothetical protein